MSLFRTLRFAWPMLTRAAVLLLLASCFVSVHAQTVTPIFAFDGTDGGNSISGLVQGRDGQLYGTTQSDGKHGAGTVFKITTGGALVTLHQFCSKTSCADGANPTSGLILGTDGNFYGTTFSGGNTACASPCGTVFKITSTGTLTTLYDFCSTSSCDDGGNPYASLVQGTDGDLYGTTSAFGLNSVGTIFRITTGGALTTLHTFAVSDGAAPFGALIQATDGNFYGTTSSGGTHGDGTVYQLTPAGSLTTIHNFSGKDGSTPYGGVIETFPGAPPFLPDALWGVASLGGTFKAGLFFRMSFAGKILSSFSFCQIKGCPDGSEPFARLTMDHTGGIRGVASSGGTADLGSLFGTTDGGASFSIYSFCTTPACADGLGPQAPLVEHTNGKLYGVTSNGATGFGAIYSDTITGRSAFVRPVPAIAKVGATIGILGSNLSTTSKVKFGSLTAKFKVVSTTFVTATVPAGATSAFITVTTSSKTFRSNQKFLISP